MVTEQDYLDAMFAVLHDRVNLCGEEDWERFKKWVVDAPHGKWTIYSGTRLWNEWWNIQESKESEELKKKFAFHGEKCFCRECKKNKSLDQFYSFDTEWVHGLRAYVSVNNGNGLCQSCHEAEMAERKKASDAHKKELKRQWYQNHKEEIAEKQRQNRASRNEANRKYAHSHREKINQYVSGRKQNDPLYKLKCQVRKTVYMSFARTGNVKSERCESITGLGTDALVDYLIGTYETTYGTPWDKKSTVHIDHIVPLATATTEEDVLRLCHYTNLRLLKPQDNLLKGAKLNYAI